MLSGVCPRPFRCLLLGLALVCTGSLLTSRWPTIYKSIVAKVVQLRPGSMNYNMWVTPPIPIHMQFYFFNWTNPEELFQQDSKPRFVQMGPYSFIETKNKKDALWNTNYTISFKQERTWYFDEERSVGRMSDEVTTLNAVAVSAAYVTRAWNFFLLLPLNQVLRNRPLFVTQTVGELLFDGYSDTLIQMAQLGAAFDMVDAVKFDKFAWFYARNGSEEFEGVYNMATGEDDVSKVAELNEWNYKNATSAYPGSCGNIEGSMGERFPPGQKKTEPLRIYTKEVCRTVEFDFSDERVVSGVSGYHYTLGSRMMDNGTLDPANECYCGGSCVPAGVMNISTCQHGAPGFVSYPHFYQADPYYLAQVDGLKPDPDKHVSYATVEPTTGLPLDVVGRLQINLLIQPYKSISAFRNLPKIFFPIFWFEEGVQISPELAFYVQCLLLLSPMGLAFGLLTASAGVLITLLALTQYYLLRTKINNTYARPASSNKTITFHSRTTKIYSPTTEDCLQNQDACLKLQCS